MVTPFIRFFATDIAKVREAFPSGMFLVVLSRFVCACLAVPVVLAGE